MKATAVCQPCSSATTFIAWSGLRRWFERLPLLFAFLMSLFSTKLGTDEWNDLAGITPCLRNGSKCLRGLRSRHPWSIGWSGFPLKPETRAKDTKEDHATQLLFPLDIHIFPGRDAAGMPWRGQFHVGAAGWRASPNRWMTMPGLPSPVRSTR
jgi:hypothetical protein